MAGENAVPSSPQPGGRPAAPDPLAVVQAFINTHYDLGFEHGAEVLSSPAALERWLRARRLLTDASVLGARDLERMLALRESLRELARANGDGLGGYARAGADRLNEAARGAPVELRFDANGPTFALAAGSGVAGARGMLLAITVRAMIDRTWMRLKICPGHDCGWAFYDHSRNQTGRWCSMSVCGGRAKARSHYRRRRASGVVG